MGPKFDLDDFGMLISCSAGGSVELSADQLEEDDRFNRALNLEDPCAALVLEGFCASLKEAEIVELRSRVIWARVACRNLLEGHGVAFCTSDNALTDADLAFVRESDRNWPTYSWKVWEVFERWRLVTLALGRLPDAWGGFRARLPKPRYARD